LEVDVCHRPHHRDDVRAEIGAVGALTAELTVAPEWIVAPREVDELLREPISNDVVPVYRLARRHRRVVADLVDILTRANSPP
jgi:hypothetical protein